MRLLFIFLIILTGCTTVKYAPYPKLYHNDVITVHDNYYGDICCRVTNKLLRNAYEFTCRVDGETMIRVYHDYRRLNYQHGCGF